MGAGLTTVQNFWLMVVEPMIPRLRFNPNSVVSKNNSTDSHEQGCSQRINISTVALKSLCRCGSAMTPNEHPEEQKQNRGACDDFLNPPFPRPQAPGELTKLATAIIVEVDVGIQCSAAVRLRPRSTKSSMRPGPRFREAF